MTGVLVVLALALVLGYSLWWTKPKVFGGLGNGFSARQTMATLHPVTYDMIERSVHEAPESITVHQVSPRVRTNTADATITFAVCRRSGLPFMDAVGPASRSCDTVNAVEGQTLHLTPKASETVTMTVTPRRIGRVVVDGMEIKYARGAGHLWQQGSQSTGPTVAIRVSR